MKFILALRPLTAPAITALALTGCVESGAVHIVQKMHPQKVLPPPPLVPPAPPAPPVPTVARIALRVAVQSIVEEPTRNACTDDIAIALRRRGFVDAGDGMLVDIAVALTPELVPAPVVDQQLAQLPRFDGPLARPTPQTFIADLSASVGLHGTRKVRVASTGSAPCGPAGDRFADALTSAISGR